MKEVTTPEKEQFLKDMELFSKNQDEEVISSEQAMAKAIMTLAKTEDKQLLTDIDEKEVKCLAALSTLADEYDVDLLRYLISHFEKLRVSLKRKGRQEILSIANAAKQAEEQGKLRRLLPFLR